MKRPVCGVLKKKYEARESSNTARRMRLVVEKHV